MALHVIWSPNWGSLDALSKMPGRGKMQGNRGKGLGGGAGGAGGVRMIRPRVEARSKRADVTSPRLKEPRAARWFSLQLA